MLMKLVHCACLALISFSTKLQVFPSVSHRRRNRGDVPPPPPSFYKLLYKLLTTLYVVVPTPIKKFFLCHCKSLSQKGRGGVKEVIS